MHNFQSAKNSEMACVVAFGCITDVQNNVKCIWFSEMRRHDLTNKKTMTMTKAITMTMTMTNENQVGTAGLISTGAP